MSKEKSGMKGKQTKATQPIFFREKKEDPTQKRERERKGRKAVDRYIRRAQQEREKERRARGKRDKRWKYRSIYDQSHHTQVYM